MRSFSLASQQIVNYMADEALIGHLAAKLRTTLTDSEDVGIRLRHLFAYHDEPHQFTTPEVGQLIDAIDSLKSLDPAVGSGAFPMGILQTLIAAAHELQASEGIDASPEGGAALAGAVELKRKGQINGSERVVLFNTGAG